MEVCVCPSNSRKRTALCIGYETLYDPLDLLGLRFSCPHLLIENQRSGKRTKERPSRTRFPRKFSVFAPLVNHLFLFLFLSAYKRITEFRQFIDYFFIT